MPKRSSTATLTTRAPKQCTATGVAGVTTTLSGKFQPRIRINGKRYDLGSYDTIEEAQEVYLNAKRTGKPECNYLKRETKPERIARGTGTRVRPHIAHTL
jgi:hypothetical protein